MLPSFFCKPEIGKEDESAKRSGPTGKLQWDGMCRISVPKGGRILVHEVKIGVDLGPTMPRDDSIGVCVGHNLVDGERKSEDDIGDGKGHQAEVTARGEGTVITQEATEVRLADDECTYGENWDIKLLVNITTK